MSQAALYHYKITGERKSRIFGSDLHEVQFLRYTPSGSMVAEGVIFVDDDGISHIKKFRPADHPYFRYEYFKGEGVTHILEDHIR
ncbi:MAG: hypothetical protein H7Z12_10275 [Rhodospirillaceae bacterium]|nr:hypothetical protein [Rhodospirillales bacterium]